MNARLTTGLEWTRGWPLLFAYSRARPAPLSPGVSLVSSVKKLAIIGGASLLVLLFCLFFPTGAAWDGGGTVQCRVHLVDSWTHNGIEHARIRIPHESQLEYLSATNASETSRWVTTDSNGDAVVSVVCGAGGGRTLLRRTGRILIASNIFVEADGYFPVSVALASIVGRSEWPLSKKSLHVELIMFKKNRDR